MGPRGPRAYGLRPRLWLLIIFSTAGKYYAVTHGKGHSLGFYPQIFKPPFTAKETATQ